MEIKRGEHVRVDLFTSIPAASNFLVVNDPVPGDLEPINSALAISSIVKRFYQAYNIDRINSSFHTKKQFPIIFAEIDLSSHQETLS